MYKEVYTGKLNKEVELVEEVNKLCWMDKNENFFDIEKFAGEGNIGHMLKQAEINKDKFSFCLYNLTINVNSTLIEI